MFDNKKIKQWIQIVKEQKPKYVLVHIHLKEGRPREVSAILKFDDFINVSWEHSSDVEILNIATISAEIPCENFIAEMEEKPVDK